MLGRTIRMGHLRAVAWRTKQPCGTRSNAFTRSNSPAAYKRALLDDAWLVDSIRAYVRVDISGYPSNNCYPGSEEFGCIRVSGYQADFHYFFVYLKILFNFEYIFVGFGVSQQGACVLRCLRRFRTLRKNTPWNFGACTLWFY